MIDQQSQLVNPDHGAVPSQDAPRGADPGKQTRAAADAAPSGAEDAEAHAENEIVEGSEAGKQRMDPWPPSSLLAAMGLDLDGGDGQSEAMAASDGAAAADGGEASGRAPSSMPAQRKATSVPASGPANADAPAPSSGGQPLAPAVRGPMEQSFGADFSAVRVHQGDHVSALGAQAYTQGTDLHSTPQTPRQVCEALRRSIRIS